MKIWKHRKPGSIRTNRDYEMPMPPPDPPRISDIPSFEEARELRQYQILVGIVVCVLLICVILGAIYGR